MSKTQIEKYCFNYIIIIQTIEKKLAVWEKFLIVGKF